MPYMYLMYTEIAKRRIYIGNMQRFLKSQYFDPTIYTCAKNCQVSVSRNFAIFWLVVRMCDHLSFHFQVWW